MTEFLQLKSSYDKEPFVQVKGFEDKVWEGYSSIVHEIKRKTKSLNKKKTIISVECYPAVRENEILQFLIKEFNPNLIIHADNASFDGDTITSLIERNLTEDRVFGVMSHFELKEFFNYEIINQMRNEISAVDEGVIFIYGVGASLISESDILIYADLARWEIQQRYRSKEFGNWKLDNFDEDNLRKYKRGYFVEWRMADRLKKELFDKMDYLLDTNKENNPKMITGEAFLSGLKQVAMQPFRVVPYFDPGVWGGQWMKEVCGLDKNEKNYAWSFDGVPEENSLFLHYGNTRVEVPSINVVYYEPLNLLGDKVHARFGAEFPIRFDFLDTMGGQNLSLQVHPLVEYIQENFGMHYTQDESYYILDAEDDAVVYLGLKEGINPNEMIDDLKKAQDDGAAFPDEKYINKFPAKKHDHFSIPAGTVHCSGKDTMVLEISASKYIFTFKLWDWERLGLDGKPRPVHIEHGEKAIQWDRTTKWVEDNLINQIEVIERGDGWYEERTGLHEREFIETRRHTFSKTVSHHTNGNLNVMNLIDGQEAIVESPMNKFDPFLVHYAETFIIPAAVGEYTIRPHGPSEGKTIRTIKAYVRN